MAALIGLYAFGQDKEETEYSMPNFEGNPVLHESERDRVTRLREHSKTNMTYAIETKVKVFQVLSISTAATDRHSRKTPRSRKSTYARHPKRSADSGHSMSNRRCAEDKLQRLLVELRSFVDEFDGFEKSLALQITETDTWVRTLYFKNKQLTARTAFAKKMFLKMKEALSLIETFVMEGTVPRLLRLLVCLNVALLNLYDDYGNPDPMLHGCGISLKEYRQSLVSWNTNVSSFADIPYRFKLLFVS